MLAGCLEFWAVLVVWLFWVDSLHNSDLMLLHGRLGDESRLVALGSWELRENDADGCVFCFRKCRRVMLVCAWLRKCLVW